jgi:hypothetical protein
MDPDPEGNFTTSPIFKTTVLTVAFSSLYFYQTGPEHAIIISPAITDCNAVSATVIETPAARKKKVIYLTFDDGPNRGTRNVLRIIEQEKVNATLFVIGEHVYGSRYQSSIYDSASRMSLLEIANHSFTHARNKYRRFYELPDSVVKDFARCADSLKLKSNIIRTPGRNIWLTSKLRSIDIKSSTAASDSLYHFGFRSIGWDLEWHFDAEQHLVQTSEGMAIEIDSAFSRQQTKTPGHLVLLAHDQAFACSRDSSSLHNFIIRLKQNENYEFEQVSKYPGL